jgi:hypothetical protein
VRRALAVVGCCALLLAACSSDPATTAQDGEGGGSKKRNERSAAAKGDKQAKPGRKGGSGKAGDGAQTDGVPAEVTQPPAAGNVDEGGFGDDPTPSEVDPSLARASQNVADGESDSTKEGLTPAHAELIGASVQGVGENVRLILRFGGRVPQESPDDKTYMVVGWGIAAGGDESYGFSAQATDEGWQVYAGGKGKATKFPGEFTVDGNAVIMEIPWDYIGGPREFEWQSNSSWFRQLANTTHYSFDLCPDDDPAQFPGG